MSTFVTTLALDGSADPVLMNLTNLAVGDAEQRQLLIDGFETSDSSIVVTLIAKRDFTDDDDDPNTIQIVASLTTPTRAPNSRLVTFVFSSDDTRELALGRVHRVQVALTRSAVPYAKTVAVGFIAATQPGSTAVAPSDEATLRAAGDASVLSAITDKIDSVTGTADRITIGGTATAPTVDIASTYAGQASINTVGTIGAGVWHGSSIPTTYTDAKVASVNGVTDRTIVSGPASAPVVDIASTYPGQTSITTLGTIGTGVWNGTPVAANKGGTGLSGFGQAGALLVAAGIAALAVLNPNVTATKKFLNQVGDGSAVTATVWAPIVSADVSDAASANTASKVVTRDASGNFAANVITANSFSGTHNGPVVGDVTGNTSGTHTGNVVGNASTATTLQTPRTINGVSFNGSANITVTADASTLTGASLNAGVSVLPAQVTGLLSGGLINPALLPALAISETFTVASQAAMLALTAQKGDVAVRSDTSTTFILSGTDPTQLSNWTLLATPVSSVLSVAGKTGVVTLVSADISDATSTNTGSRLVLRDGSGNFSAGTITAALSGNASTATALFNTRTIWGQSFNGTADITGAFAATTGTFSAAISSVGSSSSPALTAFGEAGAGYSRVWLRNGTGATTAKNWEIAKDLTVGNALQFTPSSVANSTTFTTPAATLTDTGILTLAGGLTVSAGTTSVQALTATTGVFSSNIIATRFSTTLNNSAALVVQNAAGHNTGLIGNRLDITGSGSADDAILCAFGTIGLVPGNGTVSALTVNTDLSAAFAGDVKVAATKKVFFDGGGDTYLQESSANVILAIAGGNNGIQIDGSSAPTSAQTRLSVAVGGGIGLQPVTLGAADSGGVGFKVLRVPN